MDVGYITSSSTSESLVSFQGRKCWKAKDVSPTTDHTLDHTSVVPNCLTTEVTRRGFPSLFRWRRRRDVPNRTLSSSSRRRRRIPSPRAVDERHKTSLDPDMEFRVLSSSEDYISVNVLKVSHQIFLKMFKKL